MGTDKAFVPIDGVAMVRRVATALAAGGASDVVCVGGDLRRLRHIGLAAIDDHRPGEGPLGGLLTALRWTDRSTVVVAGCDQAWLTATVIAHLIGVHETSVAAATVYRSGGVVQPLPGVYDADLRPGLASLMANGERALAAALRLVEPCVVEATDPDALRDVDRPEDLTGP